MTRQQPAGWQNWKAYPLLVDQQTEQALVKMQAEKNLSRGKALNQAIREGMVALGYMTKQMPDHRHNFEDRFGDYQGYHGALRKCLECGLVEARR